MTLLVWIAAVLALGTVSAAAQTFPSSAGPLKVETIARGLVHPWGLAFLPDGRMLVTERPGRLRIAARDGTLSAPLSGVPKVAAQGQAGAPRPRARSRLRHQPHALCLLQLRRRRQRRGRARDARERHRASAT